MIEKALRLCGLAAVLVLSTAAPTLAQTSAERAVGFLETSPDPAGSWGGAEPETAVRDTASVLRALAEAGRSDGSAFAGGAAWLTNERRENVDDVARIIVGLGPSALAFTTEDERQALRAARFRDQAWGLGFGDSRMSALDTALSLRALTDELDSESVWEVLVALVVAQNPDGGWGLGHESMVSITSEVLLAVAPFEDRIPALTAEMDQAVAFLLTQQCIGKSFITAL